MEKSKVSIGISFDRNEFLREYLKNMKTMELFLCQIHL